MLIAISSQSRGGIRILRIRECKSIVFDQRVVVSKLGKSCLICLFILIGCQPVEEKVKEENYLHYVNQVTYSFIEEMEKETGLYCSGSGGSMPHDVEEIKVMFVGYRRATIEEARALTVKGIQKLLEKINSHEKIRPFLREYPFTESRARISIAFQTNQGRRYLDGSVALVSNARNQIFYRRAEKQLIKHAPTINGATGGIFSPAYESIEERLELIIKEPYEDAVKIVEAARPPPPFKKL